MPARLPNRIHPFVQEVTFSSCESVASYPDPSVIPGEPERETIVAGEAQAAHGGSVGADLADVLCVFDRNAYHC